ncbi:MAG: hypothetical protein KDD01_01350 [Phaeodactylibacter sp.]|nr:hypothetical protein [Phaeodactylibacter sp.]
MPLKQILAITLGCAISLAACGQNSSRYLKTLGQEDFTLYFINPVPFKKGKDRLIPDFTFQYREAQPDQVAVKFSLFSKTPFREMSYLSFHAGEALLGQSSGSELMFLEKNKGKWHSRFSTHISYPALMALLNAGETLEIRFHSQESILAFPAGKKWGKASAVLKEILSAEVGKE